MRKVTRLLWIGADSNYSRQIIQGIRAFGQSHGTGELRIQFNLDEAALKRFQMDVQDWGASGIIARIWDWDTERLIKRYRLPTVNVGGTFQSSFPTVVFDGAEIGKMAARHFLGNGFRHFAFSAVTYECYSQWICRGFTRELAKAGMTCDVFRDRRKKHGDLDLFQERQRVDDWLLSLKKPAAIMCIHDMQAQEIAWDCHRLGLRIPDDVAIVEAGSDEEIAEACLPPLSNINHNAKRVGYEAARLLDRMLHGGRAPSKPVFTPPGSLTVRMSSDMVATNDPEVATAVRFIRDHAYEPINVKHILQQVPISRKTMERRFEKLIGHSPVAEIMRLRMDKATRLLEDMKLPIRAVAQQLGFMDFRNFISFFRRRTGLTPTQYRRNGLLQTAANSPHNQRSPHINQGDVPYKSQVVLPKVSKKRRRLVLLSAGSHPSSRLKPSEMRKTILAMCQSAFLTAGKLGELLHRNPNGLRDRFLTPMTDEGLLQHKFPSKPTRPDQAYIAKP